MRYARDHEPDVMGGSQSAARDDEVMGQPEPEEKETDVMGGPEPQDEVMRGQSRPAGVRYGTRPETDVMGGPSEPTDEMAPGGE
jgi:hypothetical protein